MIKIKGRALKTGIIVNIAKQIIALIIENPPLFMLFKQVITNCKTYEKGKFDLQFETVSVEPLFQNYLEKVEILKDLLHSFYTTEYPKLNISDRRGLIFEEIIATINPKKLGLRSIPICNVYREAYAQKNGKTIGKCDIDVVFDYGKIYDGIECKVNLTSYLLHEGEVKERVLRKLKYMVNLSIICQTCKLQFFPWLSTMQNDSYLSKYTLEKHGYQTIGLLNAIDIYKALEAG